MGAITQAMRREAEARGVEIRTGRAVAKIVTREGRAAGAVLEDGTEIAARAVVSNAHPRLLLQLLAEERGEWREAFSHYQSESATFRMNVALSELPDFAPLPAPHAPPPHTPAPIIAPSPP